jgi:hypothetical protein
MCIYFKTFSRTIVRIPRSSDLLSMVTKPKANQVPHNRHHAFFINKNIT